MDGVSVGVLLYSTNGPKISEIGGNSGEIGAKIMFGEIKFDDSFSIGGRERKLNCDWGSWFRMEPLSSNFCFFRCHLSFSSRVFENVNDSLSIIRF